MSVYAPAVVGICSNNFGAAYPLLNQAARQLVLAATVHADAVLPFAVAAQGFQPVAGRRSHVAQLASGVQLIQLAPRYRLDVHPARNPRCRTVQGLGILALERLNHGYIVYRTTI